MRKSDLQKEFTKQVRLIQRQLKQLEKQGITFDPKEIERYTKRSKISKDDISTLKHIRATLEEELTTSKRTVKPQELKQGTKARKTDSYIKHPRQSQEDIPTHKPRTKLDEETKKERRNYRARVRRLEKQGYDVSKLGKARDYTTEELKNLKRGALSKQAFLGEESAYDIKKREADLKRKQTIALREKIKETYSKLPIQQPMETLRPRELGDYVDVGRGALVDKFHDSSIIESLFYRFTELENRLGAPIETQKNILVDSLWDTVNAHDDGEDGLLQFEDYLRSREQQIIGLCQWIEWDSKQESIEQHFAELISLIQQAPLSSTQSESLSDFTEQYGL